MFGTPGGVEKPKLFAWKFLRKLYEVPGIEADFDGVAIHPYAAHVIKVIEQMKLMRKEMVAGRRPDAEPLGHRDRLVVGHRRQPARPRQAGAGQPAARRDEVLHRQAQASSTSRT